ncbi:MAG: CbtA family protein [Acetobacteraceae bacterium]
MAAFRALVFAALIAGVAAGLVSSALQAWTMWPLIDAAEVMETTAAAGHDQHGHDHQAHQHDGADWSPDGALRHSLTVLFNIAAGVGFGLILNALIRLWMLQTGRFIRPWEGVAWGAAGFTTFALAPALGLPPELPGMMSGELLARQIWWIATAIGTAGGIAIMTFLGPRWRGLGPVLILAPHLFGAPQADGHGPVPGEMAAAFATASLSAAAVFWVVLGWISALMQRRPDHTA